MSAVAAPAGTLRRQGAVAAAALAGGYGVVFGPGIVLALRSLGGAAAAPAAGWQGGAAALEWDVFTVAVVVALVRWLPAYAGDVARGLGLRARIGTHRFVAATAAYVAVAVVAVGLGDRVVAVLHLGTGTNTQLGHGAGAVVLTAAASVSAAVTEEIVLVALPVALIAHVAAGRRWAVPATVAVMTVLRLLPHLYYGWGSVFVVFWTLGAYAVFRGCGSVWPLVAGHVLYDWAVLALHASGR